MILELYDLDAIEGEAPVCCLNTGVHNIGRGDLIKCNDKRVSRNHALIKVSVNESPTLTSTHDNPCFIQLVNDPTIKILVKNTTKTLTEGDKFGLFPDQFWYRIKIKQADQVALPVTDTSLEIENDGDHSNHSLVFDISENSNEARGILLNSNDHQSIENCLNSADNTENAVSSTINIDTFETNDENNDSNSTNTSCNNNENIDRIENVNTQNQDTAISNTSIDSSNLLQEEINLNCDNTDANLINEANVEQNDTNRNAIAVNNASNSNPQEETPSTSTGVKRKRRERCMYADKCYRKNPQHKKEFSHPSDSDYESDTEDTRPVCCYGANCYRKNMDHLRDYKHPRSGKRPTKQRKLTNQDPVLVESSEDDYDYDDPFLDDGSEDEYQAESWSEDSDFDTQDFDEDDEENTKSLIKEANRFTKKKRPKK